MKIKNHLSYNIDYYQKKHGYMDVCNSYYVNNLIEKLICYGDLKKSHKILEIGCGKGRFSFPLLKKGYNLTCIDSSENLLDEFKKNILSDMQVDIIKGDFNNLAKRMKNKFDRIIGLYVLHHLEDSETSFRNMRIMLKKEGRIVFSENNPYNVMYYIQMAIVKDITWEGEKGILNMRKSIIYPLLEFLKFKDIKIERYGFFPPQIVNTKFGQGLEKKFEKIKLFYPFLPFQVIMGTK